MFAHLSPAQPDNDGSAWGLWVHPPNSGVGLRLTSIAACMHASDGWRLETGRLERADKPLPRCLALPP